VSEEAIKPGKPNLRLVPATPPPLVGETGGPTQGEMPFAVVEGEPITELPRDLFRRTRSRCSRRLKGRSTCCST
jgi:hypothetical protein